MKSFSAAPTAPYCCWNLAGLEVFQRCLQTVHQMDVLVHKSRHCSSTVEQIICCQWNLRLEIFYAEIQLIWPVCPLRLKSTAKSISVLLLVACSLWEWISLQSQSTVLNKSKRWILHLPQAILSCESWCPLCLPPPEVLSGDWAHCCHWALIESWACPADRGQVWALALQGEIIPCRGVRALWSPIADSKVWRRKKNLLILLFYFFIFLIV